MDPKVNLRDDGFSLTWSPVNEGSEYRVLLERCDRQYLRTGGSGIDCKRILSENVSVAIHHHAADFLQLDSGQVLDPCQFYYNVRIETFGTGGSRLFKETSMLAKYIQR